jgi:hypothetical protein
MSARSSPAPSADGPWSRSLSSRWCASKTMPTSVPDAPHGAEYTIMHRMCAEYRIMRLESCLESCSSNHASNVWSCAILHAGALRTDAVIREFLRRRWCSRGRTKLKSCPSSKMLECRWEIFAFAISCCCFAISPGIIGTAWCPWWLLRMSSLKRVWVAAVPGGLRTDDMDGGIRVLYQRMYVTGLFL